MECPHRCKKNYNFRLKIVYQKLSDNLYKLVSSKLVDQSLILELPYLKKDFLILIFIVI